MKETTSRSCVRGFTLIELLIVVAIIAILAAIAVPNFLEAQTRAKISRVKADMRAMATATEAYRLDNNKYPAWGDAYYLTGDGSWPTRMARLTTPIAYLSSLPHDPFFSTVEGNPQQMYDYVVAEFFKEIGGEFWYRQAPEAPLVPYDIQVLIRSWGPDDKQEIPDMFGPGYHINQAYDPTNGTRSRGEVFALLPGPTYYP